MEHEAEKRLAKLMGQYAVLNEVVWRLFDTNTWVAFKVWGVMPLTIVFSLFQLPLLSKFAPDPTQPIDPIPPMDPLP